MVQVCCVDFDVEICFQDYCDLYDSFDCIVFVGMFEYVGLKNYVIYFEVVDCNLKFNGCFLLYIIGFKVIDYNVDLWIDKYIFLNGCLFFVCYIVEVSEKYFVMEDWYNFGVDYDMILMVWYECFFVSWLEIVDNYFECFKCMFIYYLNVCVGVFCVCDIQFWQVVFLCGIEYGLCVVC